MKLGFACLWGSLAIIGCSSKTSNPSNAPNSCDASVCQAGQGGAASSGASTASGGSAGGTTAPTATGGNANLLVADPNGETPRGLQINGEYLYWLSGNSKIARARVDGTGATTIYTYDTKDSYVVELGAIAVDDSHVYYTYSGSTSADRGLYMLPLDGSAAPTKVVSATSPYGVALEGSDMCFEDSGDVRCLTKQSNTAMTVMHGGVDYRTNLLVHGGYVYFPAAASSTDAEQLYRAKVDKAVVGDAGLAAAEQISVDPGRMEILLSPVVDGDYIYWTTSAETVYRWSSSGGTAAAVATIAIATEIQTAPPPHDVLYVTGGTIYWVSSGMMSGSTVYKQAVTNGTRTVVAGGGVTAMVANTAYLFGTSSQGILRYAR